jgi:hypothetical protein
MLRYGLQVRCDHVIHGFAEQVAAWLAEVGGPAFYSSTYGGYPRMISQPVG